MIDFHNEWQAKSHRNIMKRELIGLNENLEVIHGYAS